MSKNLIHDVIQTVFEFHQRRLWRRFTNHDCFVVRVPGAEDPLLASVMGFGSEQYGLVLFQGPHAAASFSALAAGADPGEDTIDQTDMLGFSLVPFGSMNPAAQAFLRQAGIHPRHDEAVPDFLVKPSHHRARLPNDAELGLLLAVLKGVVVADRRRLLKPAGLDDEDGVCAVTLHGAAASPTVSVTRERLLRRSASAQPMSAAGMNLHGLELLDASWLVGTPACPAGIKNDDRSLRLLLVVDEAGGLVLHASPIFSEHIQEAVDALVETFHGHPPNNRPGVAKRILFSSRRLYEAVAPALREMGAECRYQAAIPKLQAVAAEFLDFLGREVPASDGQFGDREPGEDRIPAPDDLAGWKQADRYLAREFGGFLQDGDLLRSARAVRRYFGDDDLGWFLKQHEQRGVAMAYSAWGVLDFRPRKTSPTQAERLLAQGLPPAQEILLRARMEAYPSIYRVAGHDPRAGTVDLEDVLLGGSVTVHDQLMSENIADITFLVLRVFPAGQFHFLELAGPPLGAGMGNDAVEFLRDRGLKFARDGLKRNAHKFGWLWGWCDTWQATWRPPRLCNTEGDPILLHTASFAVADPLETRRALLDRNDIEYDQQEDDFTWFRDAGQASQMLGGTISLGRIQLVGDELVLTVNSDNRFKTARQWLTELPGVTFLEVMTQSMESLAQSGPLDDRLAASQPVEIRPEMAAALQEIVDRQSMTWIDTPLPILGGRTPREACRTRSGRERVTTLIRTMPDPVGPAPVRVPRQAMLRELGLDAEPPLHDDSAS